MIGTQKKYICKPVRFHAGKWSAGLMVYLLVLSVVAGTAWSFEQVAPQAPHKSASNTKLDLVLDRSSSSSVPSEDACLSFLKDSVHNHDPSSSFDAYDRRAAGKAAALGLVFGVRYALGPKEIKADRQIKPYLSANLSGNTSRALAIADYRRCKNEQALKAAGNTASHVVPNWRWMR